MKEKITNPFITGGYISSEYFCNREHETNQLLMAITSKRNLTLISIRRMGKTGLLKHVKMLLENKKSPPVVIYTDLMPTRNGSDMLNTISTALMQIKKDESKFIEKLLLLLTSLRPKLTYDNLTGQPVLSLTIESPADIQFGLRHLLDFISEIRNELVFMFDEFQQIATYPEKNIEQMLRSVIQACPRIPFIFSGSSKHMLESMFFSANRPFYQSSEIMYLDHIPEAEYEKFITQKLEASGRSISHEALDRVFRWTRMHTYNVQYVCNLLYESGQEIINADDAGKIFHRILISNEPLYSTYRNLIPSHQYKLLQAIAIENGIEKPMSGQFIRKYDLTSASSVKTSLKALSDKEMIVLENDRWMVYDVFFSRWLEYHYKQ